MKNKKFEAIRELPSVVTSKIIGGQTAKLSLSLTISAAAIESGKDNDSDGDGDSDSHQTSIDQK